MISKETFDQHWTNFIADAKPGTFTQTDRTLCFCFYTKGWLDATRPVIDQIGEDTINNLAEAAYERSQGECFRGDEAAAFAAEEQARIQRELK
jgi:hypothetical protein